ncbi:MAG TPA: hypothetical protein VKY90_06165 [Candidatus Dormibacteraeota bacterium]|nr:hypothetical protein [Candidatus Dormibacteraeota bacterium]
MSEDIEHQVKARFPEGVVRQVVLLHYGDDPTIEPGGMGIRLIIDPEHVPEGSEHPVGAFHQAHQTAIKQLSRDLPHLAPGATRLEISDGNNSLFLMRPGAAQEGRASDLTPVMTRLGPADLETLDTLIKAGIASNRAEAVRWALARLRERPAYTQLRERAREIEELKTQF